jgi:L-amino acid N-acyltransferase YncA
MTEIRRAREEDFNAIWPILHEVFREGETYPHAPDTTREAAHRYWMATPTATYVAVDRGEIAGTYYLRPNQVDLGAHVCNAGYMVGSAHRNRGIGTAMGRHSIAEARKLGFRAMQFNLVVATNEPSLRIWEKLGFRVVGTLTGAFRHRTLGFVDALVMYRDLTDGAS